MLSHRVVERLIVYRRLLHRNADDGRERIYSHELAKLAGVTPAQVRRDLMTIDYAGSPARGYAVAELARNIGRLLDRAARQPTALVGLGHLGQALLDYFSRADSPLTITAAFDVNPTKIDRVSQGCRCFAASALERVVEDLGIRVALLAIPVEAAQGVADRLARAGVRGILNFTPTHLHLPDGLYLENVDIAILLEKVAFFALRGDEAPPSSPGR